MGFMRGLLVAALATMGSLALAAPAGATITQTHITTPSASPTYLTYNDNNPNTFEIAGTTNSNDTTTDTVDIDCFYGDDGQFLTVANGVMLGSNGSFSVPAAPLSTVYDHECQLAAVPSGDTTLEPSYTGPQLEVSERESEPISGPPNAGKLSDYYAWGQQTGLADDYDSIGTCGLCDSYLQDSAGGITSIVFFANSFLWYGNEEEQGDTRSEIEVDGRNAYDPAAAAMLYSGSSNTPGLPSLTWAFSQNPRTGDVTIAETDGIARCAGSSSSSSYPPTSTTCPKFKSTGVQVSRKIVQSASGHVVSITDRFKSTDGHSHRLDLLYDNAQCLANKSCVASTVGYRFAGHHAYKSHAPGNVVHMPSGVGSSYVKILGAPDGDPYSGQGALTYGQAPAQITFIHGFATPPGTQVSEFVMHYRGKVPAKGTLTYRFVYSTSSPYAPVHDEAPAAQRALKAGRPAVMPAGPAPPRVPAGSADMPTRNPTSKHLHH